MHTAGGARQPHRRRSVRGVACGPHQHANGSARGAVGVCPGARRPHAAPGDHHPAGTRATGRARAAPSRGEGARVDAGGCRTVGGGSDPRDGGGAGARASGAAYCCGHRSGIHVEMKLHTKSVDMLWGACGNGNALAHAPVALSTWVYPALSENSSHACTALIIYVQVQYMISVASEDVCMTCSAWSKRHHRASATPVPLRAFEKRIQESTDVVVRCGRTPAERTLPPHAPTCVAHHRVNPSTNTRQHFQSGGIKG